MSPAEAVAATRNYRKQRCHGNCYRLSLMTKLQPKQTRFRLTLNRKHSRRSHFQAKTDTLFDRPGCRKTQPNRKPEPTRQMRGTPSTSEASIPLPRIWESQPVAGPREKKPLVRRCPAWTVVLVSGMVQAVRIAEKRRRSSAQKRGFFRLIRDKTDLLFSPVFAVPSRCFRLYFDG